MTEGARRAVFVDRDGVLNRLVPDPETNLPESPLQAAQVELLPGVPAALRALRSAGFLIVCVTNQPAAAKEKTTVTELQSVQDKVIELLALEGAELDHYEMCLHHPEGTVPELRGGCDCRKPAPGMLLHAARQLEVDLAASWMIGDSESDITAGLLAGCRAILVEHPESSHRRERHTGAEAAVADLPEAVRYLSSAGADC